MILPDADWRHRAGLDALVDVLDPARFVGGAVRDTLLGIAVADIDLATPHAPDVVLRRLRQAGIRAVPTGIAHGTITAVLADGPVEVTTLRRDVATDGRHATVAFTDDWREDAARRDFTINALYADPVSGAVFDYFGGVEDLAARRVRFIGDPLQRIAEDHLRILRFFRFLARFGDSADPAGLDACTARARDLMALSRERIRDELLKLLVAQGAVAVVQMMLERNILTPVLPEIASADGLGRLAAAEAAANIAPDPIRRLAALLGDAATAEQVGARLKLSNAQRRRLVQAIGVLPAGGARMAVHALGAESALDRALLSQVPATAVAAIRDCVLPRFPLSGGAIVARGVRAGPDVARLLRAVEQRWLEEDCPAAARVDAIADELVAQALRATSRE